MGDSTDHDSGAYTVKESRDTTAVKFCARPPIGQLNADGQRGALVPLWCWRLNKLCVARLAK